MKAWFAVPALLFSLCLPPRPVVAQTHQPQPEPPKFSTRVQVKISAPEPVKNAVATLTNSELRALGDVVVADSNPNYRLSIMAIPNRTRQETVGFTFSVLITRPLDPNILSPLLLSDEIDEKKKILLLFLSSRYEYIEKQSLLTSSNEDIPKTVHEIVHGFNVDLIEKDRKLWNMVWGPQSKNPTGPTPGKQ